MADKINTPDIELLKAELARTRYRKRFVSALRSTVYTFLIIAAFALLAATLWLPVMQVYGTSMEPVLNNGDTVVGISTEDLSRGDIAAFYVGNKLLIKRVIGCEGDVIDISPEGVITVGSLPLDEPYVTNRTKGPATAPLPCTVPEGHYFFLSDSRDDLSDSRSSTVGCVAKDQIAGKVVFRIWPLSDLGFIG